MKLFVLVLALWGQTEAGDWVYIGNQYVFNTPMPLEQCELMAELDNWSWHEDNDFYTIQLDCQEV